MFWTARKLHIVFLCDSAGKEGPLGPVLSSQIYGR